MSSAKGRPSAYGDGVIAISDDRELAERVVAKLNEVDPEPRRRAPRGMGWW